MAGEPPEHRNEHDAHDPPRTSVGRAIDSIIEQERSVVGSVRDEVQQLRTGKRPRLNLRGRITHAREDAIAGATSAIANVPSDLTSGVLAGVNPVYGLYTLMVGMPIAAIFTSTRKMMFDSTSAMTLVAVAGLGSRQGDDRVEALLVIALIAGVFQMALGLLGLGFLTRFVSNAVMTGFLTGIAVSIILGQLWDLTGYTSDEDGSKLEKTVILLGHLADVDPWTTVIGVGSIIGLFLLNRTPLKQFNLLVVLAIATAAAQLKWLDSVVLVNSLGEIPRSLPTPHMPELRMIPNLALTGIAVALVGLLQAAGVAQRFPNSGGADPDDSRDFFAQGVANVTCSVFRGMPGGGSLSGTALNVAAGAQTRFSLFIQAGVVVILVLIFSDLLSIIPMASLSAILIYSAILAIKPESLRTVMGTTRASTFALLVTFCATLVVPLQQAVILGVVLAAVLYLYRSSTEVRVVEVTQQEQGYIRESEPPAALPSNKVTVLDTYGSLFYAGARTLGQQLPKAIESDRAVVVLRIRGQGDLGSTFLSVAGRYAGQLRARNGALLLSGVEPAVKERMARTGHLNEIGADHVFVATADRGASTDEAIRAGERIVAQARTGQEEPTSREDAAHRTDQRSTGEERD